MGFLKRLFSKSDKSKGSKSKSSAANDLAKHAIPEELHTQHSHHSHTRSIQSSRSLDVESEASLSKLLRSTSTRLEIRSQHDLLAPPNMHTSSSRASLTRGRSSTPPGSYRTGSRAPSPTSPGSVMSTLSSNRSYNVTVYEKTVHTPGKLASSSGSAHASTIRRSASASPSPLPLVTNKRKSPDRSPHNHNHNDDFGPDDEDDDAIDTFAHKRRRHSTKSDKSVQLRLRKDPSVATLLNMYDTAGELGDNAFESPDKAAAPVGRIQRQRTGSTLRELLGDDVDALEGTGDISWAERLLGETEGDNALSSKESLVPTVASFKPFNASNGQPTVTSSALDISSEISKDGSEPDMPSLDVETSDRSIPSARIPLNPISPGMTELGRLNKPIAFTGNESFAFLEKPSFMEDDNDNDSPVKSTATSAASTAKPSAAAVATGSVLESPSKATTAPIQPASQAFAFLMAPRRPKQSTVSLDGPRSMGSIEPEAPPVPPPTLDMAQISHLLAPGHGRSGSFVRHGPTGRIFATGINDNASTASDKPTASGLKSNLKAGASTGNLLAIPGPSSSSYAVQRSRSHSTGIADMLGPSSGSHSTGHRRSATVTNSPTRGLEIRAQPTGGSTMNLGTTGTGSRMPRGPRPLSRGQSLGPADVMAYEQMSRTRTRSPSPLMVGNREVSVAVASSSRQTLDVDIMRAYTFSSGSGSGSGSGRHKRTHSSTIDVLTTSTSATTHTEQSTKTYTGPSRPAKHRRVSSHMSPSLLFELEDVAHAEVRVATKTEVRATGATTVSPSTLNMAKAPSGSRRTPAPGSPTPKRNKENAMGSMASRLPRATTPPSSFMLGMLSVKSTTNTNTDSNTDTNTAANARTPVSKARHEKGDKSDRNDFDFAFSTPKLPLPFGFESRSPPTAHKAFSHDRDIDLNLDFRMDDGDTVRRPAAAAAAVAAATLPTAVTRADIPMTPIRVRALLGVPPGPPSPGSTSTELSPMGKEMMAIVREQKLKTREREVGRERGAKEGKTERAAKGERTERASKKRAGSTSTRLRV